MSERDLALSVGELVARFLSLWADAGTSKMDHR